MCTLCSVNLLVIQQTCLSTYIIIFLKYQQELCALRKKLVSLQKIKQGNMDKILFKDYYYLLGLQVYASEEDIKNALHNLEGKRSPILLYEIKMILLNKELKILYDQEYKLYSEAASKQNYEIQNHELRKFLEDTKVQEDVSVNIVTELSQVNIHSSSD